MRAWARACVSVCMHVCVCEGVGWGDRERVCVCLNPCLPRGHQSAAGSVADILKHWWTPERRGEGKETRKPNKTLCNTVLACLPRGLIISRGRVGRPLISLVSDFSRFPRTHPLPFCFAFYLFSLSLPSPPPHPLKWCRKFTSQCVERGRGGGGAKKWKKRAGRVNI